MSTYRNIRKTTKIEKVRNVYWINDKYTIYPNGAVYGPEAKDVPPYILFVRDTLLGIKCQQIKIGEAVLFNNTYSLRIFTSNEYARNVPLTLIWDTSQDNTFVDETGRTFIINFVTGEVYLLINGTKGYRGIYEDFVYRVITPIDIGGVKIAPGVYLRVFGMKNTTIFVHAIYDLQDILNYSSINGYLLNKEQFANAIKNKYIVEV